MALKKADIANFNTLKRAALNGDLVLMQCKDTTTGEYRAVLCAMQWDGNECKLVPFGHMATGNPYEQYIDPIQSMEQDVS